MTAQTAPTAAEHAAMLARYQQEGVQREQAIGNRGPLRLNDDGTLHGDLLSAYREQGYYIFEDVVADEEIEALRAGINEMLERAPVDRDSDVDHAGRPAFGQEFERKTYTFVRPLADPWGGTDLLGGRHPSKMVEPKPAQDAPRDVVYLMGGMCQAMEAGLRLYGHPRLLAVAAAINGDDFVPFNDAVFVKQPGLGGSVAWHQDGVTHWQNPDWDPGIHGFNFQVQLYPSTPGNCLWVVPGSHKLGKIDIQKRVAENGGSEQLPGAIPLTCRAGDVTVVNRQMLHCSFANTSEDLRISLTFGFHRRGSVLGARGSLGQDSDQVYDEQRVFDRSAVIAVAIDARHQHYPNERAFQYQPFAGLEDEYRWTPANYERVVRNYNLKDLSI